MTNGKKRNWRFRFIKGTLRRFKSKVVVTKLFEGDYETTAVFISNHSGASGPMNLAIYFSEFFRPLGTYEMVGKYKERWHYLYHIFYKRKLKYNKLKAYILATLFAIISRILYNDIGLIPTYSDARFITTIKTCIQSLKEEKSILVFPEDSASGYTQEIAKFLAGFVVITRKFFEATGVDLPIYPMYFSKKRQRIIVGEKIYIQPLINQGWSDDKIADSFRIKINEYSHIIYGEIV